MKLQGWPIFGVVPLGQNKSEITSMIGNTNFIGLEVNLFWEKERIRKNFERLWGVQKFWVYESCRILVRNKKFFIFSVLGVGQNIFRLSSEH